MRKTTHMIMHAVVFVALVLCFVTCPLGVEAGRKPSIAILKSWDIAPYNVTVEGVIEEINAEKIECDTVIYDLGGGRETPEEIIEEIRKLKPDVILAVGTRATSLVAKNITDIPIVFSAVLYPVASDFVPDMKKPGGNLTGSSLDVPIEQQLKTLSEIVPKLKRVGVLYSPRETAPVVEEARRVAKKMNLELLAEQVDSESDVDDALKKLDKEKMDALWSVVDGVVLTPASKGYIGKYVVRRGIPFMVPSNRYLKDGALVALNADYRDCGRQAGEILVKILHGANPKDIPVATPRTVEMGLNLRVASIISLEIPQSLIDKASVIIQ